MAVSSIESGLGDGYSAKVDSTNRLFTRAAVENPAKTVVTSLISSSNGANVTVNARTNRTSLVLQNLAGVPVAVRFAAANAGATDFNIPALGTFVLPFAYDGEFRIFGVGGGGDFVVIEGVDVSVT